MDKELLLDFEAVFLPLGRMISASKSSYIRRYPYNPVVFNANVLVRKEENSKLIKIWHGDLDLNKDFNTLKNLAQKVKELYILNERDGRFEREENPQLQNFVVRFFDGQAVLSEDLVESEGKVFKKYNPRECEEIGGFHSINVDDLYKDRKYEMVKLPIDLKEDFSWKKCQDFLYEYGLKNIDKIMNEEITFFHKELRDFFIKDFLKRKRVSNQMEQEVLSFFSSEKTPKEFIKFLYMNRSNLEYEALLKECLHFDSMYVATNEKTAQKIYKKVLDHYYKNEKMETSEEDLVNLKLVVNKDCTNLLKLISFFQDSHFGHEIKEEKNRRELENILPLCRKEAYELYLKGAEADSFLLLNQVKNYIKNGTEKIISFSHVSNCPEDHIFIPWTKGIIF